MRFAALFLLLAAAACSRTQAPAATDAPAEAPVAHGDHSPHHGGIVMMKGDLHYEVVLAATGAYRVFFTDATRAELPATTASTVAIVVMRPGESPEGVELRIDEAGESWVGQGRPVSDVAGTKARISYTIRGEEPYWIDLPFDPKAIRTEAHQ